jgi:hypothetical protein
LNLNLRNLAKAISILDGAATVYLLPTLPLKITITQDALESIYPPDKWTQIHHTFCLLDGTCVGFEVHDETNTEAQVIANWYDNRSGEIVSDFELFGMMSALAAGALLDAYLDTRTTLPKADAIIQEDSRHSEDETKKKNTGKRSTVKS